MTERKLSVMFATFSYGGNGGMKSEHPDVRDWLLDTIPKAKADPRIEAVYLKDFSDTPITMNRNAAVITAREAKVDLLCMIDSDMRPDCELRDGDPSAKPFWDVAFNFIYRHYDKGPACIAAPYCGPPPHENVFVFRWRKRMNQSKNVDWWLDQYVREEAAEKAGIEPVAALPTGLILFDLRCFQLIEPETPLHSGHVSDRFGWFHYEWKDQYCAEKASTEDVTTTRNISMAGMESLGYSPIYVAWDCWAGHWKPHCVPKPRFLPPDSVSAQFRAACNRLPFGTRRVNLPGLYRDVLGGGGNGSLNSPEKMVTTGVNVADNAWHITPPEDLAVLQRLVREAAERNPDTPLEIIEIGSYAGQTAVAMADVLAELPNGGTIRCVDTWEGTVGEPNGEVVQEMHSRGDNLYQIFAKNTENYQDLIVAHRGASVEVAKTARYAWPKAHLIFVDASHFYEDVCADIDNWMPLLAPNGIMVGHDYCSFEGVREAVWDRFHNWHTHDNFWIFRRDSDRTLAEVNGELNATHGTS